MTLGREMHDGVDRFFRKNPSDPRFVADIGMHKTVAIAVLLGDAGQTAQAAGIRQRVQVDHADRRIGGQQVADEIDADEPGAAGD